MSAWYIQIQKKYKYLYMYMYMYMYGVLVRKNGKCFGICSQILPTEIYVICKTLIYIYNVFKVLQQESPHCPAYSSWTCRGNEKNQIKRRQVFLPTRERLQFPRVTYSIRLAFNFLYSIFYKIPSRFYNWTWQITYGKVSKTWYKL